MVLKTIRNRRANSNFICAAERSGRGKLTVTGAQAQIRRTKELTQCSNCARHRRREEQYLKMQREKIYVRKPTPPDAAKPNMSPWRRGTSKPKKTKK